MAKTIVAWLQGSAENQPVSRPCRRLSASAAELPRCDLTDPALPPISHGGLPTAIDDCLADSLPVRL